MRAATASAREPRGERTLMGIGPEFIRREIVADGVSGTLDGVPHERMDRTPSSPIVVEAQAVTPAPTVRMPVPAAARTVQLSAAPAPTVVLPVEQAAPEKGPSLRLNSLVSGRFFQEGEQQEAKNWEDSPLVNEPFPDEVPPKISSFDHVPRHRAPLIVTTFLLGTALVIGLAVEGAGTRAARAWLATEAGPRAVEVWNRAKTGLAMRLTTENTAASARAMAAPAASPEAPAPQPAAPPAVAATPAAVAVPASAAPAARPERADATSTEDLWAPLVAAGPRPPITPHVRRAAPTRANDDEPRAAGRADVRSSDDEPGVAARAESPRRGLVWSPSEERLVPAQAASVDLPATGEASRSDLGARVKGDKDVLPLDDEAHTTY